MPTAHRERIARRPVARFPFATAWSGWADRVRNRFERSPASRARTRATKIDFSDVPESSDEELGRTKRIGRPKTGQAKQLIAIRIAPNLRVKLRRIAPKQGKPYQTCIHELLDGSGKKSRVAN